MYDLYLMKNLQIFPKEKVALEDLTIFQKIILMEADLILGDYTQVRETLAKRLKLQQLEEAPLEEFLSNSMREYLKKYGYTETQIYNQAVSQKEKAIEEAKSNVSTD